MNLGQSLSRNCQSTHCAKLLNYSACGIRLLNSPLRQTFSRPSCPYHSLSLVFSSCRRAQAIKQI
ncbi:hypothetical protein Mapa_012397 [Marchantia paleacea]|nr:hypothetical protein Mapa_012397 [Marchantia paleacea]